MFWYCPRYLFEFQLWDFNRCSAESFHNYTKRFLHKIEFSSTKSTRIIYFHVSVSLYFLQYESYSDNTANSPKILVNAATVCVHARRVQCISNEHQNPTDSPFQPKTFCWREKQAHKPNMLRRKCCCYSKCYHECHGWKAE